MLGFLENDLSEIIGLVFLVMNSITKQVLQNTRRQLRDDKRKYIDGNLPAHNYV